MVKRLEKSLEDALQIEEGNLKQIQTGDGSCQETERLLSLGDGKHSEQEGLWDNRVCWFGLWFSGH